MSQENNEISRELTKMSGLSGRDFEAIQLRYMGKTSREIAEVTGFNEDYVRQLFMQGGRLEKAYKEFALIQQKQAQEKVTAAINRAREEAYDAIERIIALSKDACNEAAIFKANEYVLSIAGIQQGAALKDFFKGKTYEQAKKIVDDLFVGIYSRPVGDGLKIIVQRAEGSKENNTLPGGLLEIS